jgi:uncharacterized delta-60 repeat protein
MSPRALLPVLAATLAACTGLVGQSTAPDAGPDGSDAVDDAPAVDVAPPRDAPPPRAACLGAPLGAPGDVLPSAPGWTSSAGLPAGASARALVFDARGGLLVGAYAPFVGARGAYDAVFLRFDDALAFDRAFGDGGRLQVDAVSERPGVDVIHDAFVDHVGRLLFAGWSAVPGGEGNRAVALRFTPDGRPDAEFGRDGVASVASPGGFSAYSLYADARGIVLAGTTVDNYLGVVGVAARLDDRGALDPTFGDGGRVTIPQALALRGVVPDGDGYLALTGDPDTLQPALVRLDARGAVDAAFGVGGRAAHPRAIDFAPATLRRLPDGRLLAAGAYLPIHNALSGLQTLVRFEADGRADLSYGFGGLVEERAGALPFVATSTVLALQCDGAALTATTAAGTSALVQRFTPDGRLDATFGRNGTVILPRLVVPTTGQALRVASDQRSVIVLSVATDGRLGLHRVAL